ncbi:MAG: hypothetical protein V7738_18690 [Dietzia maris]
MNSLVTALVDLNPTRADYANIRHALAATTERGLTLAEARMVLTTATEKVVGDLMATALTQPDADQGTAADLDDPTKPTAQEVLALDAILTRALAVYNGRRPPYTVGATIGTDSGVKSINRAAVARRILYRGETDAKITRMHITKTELPGKTKAPRYQFTVAAVLTAGTRVRALSASIVQTPKGLKIAAFNPLHR